MTHAQFCYSVCGFFPPWETVTKPNVTVADRLPKHLMFDCRTTPVCNCYQDLEGGSNWPYMGEVNNNKMCRMWEGITFNSWNKCLKAKKLCVGL